MAELSRRVVLLGVAGVVVGAGVLESASRSPGTGAVAPASDSGFAPVAATEGHVVPRRITTRPPEALRHWKAPLYDLSDFVHANPGTTFPHRSVALTIDDGPHPVWTPRYLALLAKHDIKATFHLIGAQVMAHRHLVKAMAGEGHALANHTWTHDEHLPSRRPKDIRREIVDTNDVIHRAAGVTPTLFRAPGGVWGPRLYAELDALAMTPVAWNVDPRDWAEPGTPAIASALRRARAGDIVLCHDGGGDRSQTFAALQVVLPELKHRGLRFVAL